MEKQLVQLHWERLVFQICEKICSLTLDLVEVSLVLTNDMEGKFTGFAVIFLGEGKSTGFYSHLSWWGAT